MSPRGVNAARSALLFLVHLATSASTIAASIALSASETSGEVLRSAPPDALLISVTEAIAVYDALIARLNRSYCAESAKNPVVTGFFA
jgi:hypothetical protein